MLDWLTEPFGFEFFRRALAAGTLVGAMCGAIGVFVLLRHLAYIGHGLSYGMLAGVAGATIAGANPYVGALAATALGGLLIDRVRRLRGLGGDAAIGIVSTTLFAVGVAIISADRSRGFNLEGLLFGNVLGVQAIDVALVVAATVAVTTFLVATWRALVFSTFDPDVAETHGVRVRLLDLLFSLVIGLIVVVALRVVGVLLITAILVLPAAVARLATRSLGRMVVLGAVVGGVSNVIGLFVSYYTDMASGPAVVLVAATMFAVAALADVVSGRRQATHARRRARAGAAARPAPSDADIG
jgi:manganese/iron transport system permease protein/iron/zinc/copper transport system permease protein